MRNWADLPEELLSLILSNLFAKDRYTFSLVCKSWNTAAFCSPYRHSPCLMFFQRSSGLWKFFQYNGFFSMEIPQLQNAEILCSKYGWLLMSRSVDNNLFFFNPFNNRSFGGIPKPFLPYKRICFFHHPTSPDCIIVGIKSIEPGSLEISVFKLGGDIWNRCEYICRTPFMLSDCAPVLHRGVLYLLDMKGNVARFDMSKPGHQSSWATHTNCLRPARLRAKIRQLFLIKFHGEEEEEEEVIFAVFVVHDERKVSVFRLLESEMQWQLVKDLGNKMLFVSQAASYAANAPLKSMANKIYFCRLHDEDYIFYSLDTQKYHSFDGNYSNSKGYGIKELNFATWIIPTPT